MEKTKRFVKVSWLDSMTSGDNWKHQKEVDDLCKSGPARIISVGIVYHEMTDEEPWLTIGMDNSNDFVPGHGIGCAVCTAMICIPTVAIYEIVTLEPADVLEHQIS